MTRLLKVEYTAIDNLNLIQITTLPFLYSYYTH